MSNFQPYRAELPLDPLEAFRLASFGIEYVPQYAPVMMDRHCAVWFDPQTGLYSSESLIPARAWFTDLRAWEQVDA